MTDSVQPTSAPQPEETPKGFHRAYNGRALAGVFAGLARRNNASVALYQLVGLILVLITSPLGLAVYLGAWLYFPQEQPTDQQRKVSRLKRLAIFGSIIVLITIAAVVVLLPLFDSQSNI